MPVDCTLTHHIVPPRSRRSARSSRDNWLMGRRLSPFGADRSVPIRFSPMSPSRGSRLRLMVAHRPSPSPPELCLASGDDLRVDVPRGTSRRPASPTHRKPAAATDVPCSSGERVREEPPVPHRPASTPAGRVQHRGMRSWRRLEGNAGHFGGPLVLEHPSDRTPDHRDSSHRASLGDGDGEEIAPRGGSWWRCTRATKAVASRTEMGMSVSMGSRSWHVSAQSFSVGVNRIGMDCS